MKQIQTMKMLILPKLFFKLNDISKVLLLFSRNLTIYSKISIKYIQKVNLKFQVGLPICSWESIFCAIFIKHLYSLSKYLECFSSILQNYHYGDCSCRQTLMLFNYDLYKLSDFEFISLLWLSKLKGTYRMFHYQNLKTSLINEYIKLNCISIHLLWLSIRMNITC